MSKSDGSSGKKARNKNIRWIITIFFTTIVVSGTISFVSDEIMAASATVAAFFILLAIVLIGILFDIIGVAVTSADERPFHSMAARKVPGAIEALRLLRKAERVSSICNDVVGDICGVISGAASATIAAQALRNLSDVTTLKVVPIVMSALVAGLTVGGKAIGKAFAIGSCTAIVHMVGRVIHFVSGFGRMFRKEN